MDDDIRNHYERIWRRLGFRIGCVPQINHMVMVKIIRRNIQLPQELWEALIQCDAYLVLPYEINPVEQVDMNDGKALLYFYETEDVIEMYMMSFFEEYENDIELKRKVIGFFKSKGKKVYYHSVDRTDIQLFQEQGFQICGRIGHITKLVYE